MSSEGRFFEGKESVATQKPVMQVVSLQRFSEGRLKNSGSRSLGQPITGRTTNLRGTTSRTRSVRVIAADTAKPDLETANYRWTPYFYINIIGIMNIYLALYGVHLLTFAGGFLKQRGRCSLREAQGERGCSREKAQSSRRWWWPRRSVVRQVLGRRRP